MSHDVNVDYVNGMVWSRDVSHDVHVGYMTGMMCVTYRTDDLRCVT